MEHDDELDVAKLRRRRLRPMSLFKLHIYTYLK